MLNSEVKQSVSAEDDDSELELKKLISLYKKLNDKCDVVIDKIKNKKIKK